ncbi:MAG: PLP-dependent aminotransferase family protein [Treponema sp.]|nr:PLP-dependent aminotransferase family protein [Treponema sp.]
MITISFENRGNCGLCEYLYNSIKNQIVQGALKSNEKLPSKRTLAQNLGVSVITVQNAYAQLISEGYIYSIEKKGFFVTDLKPFEKETENSSFSQTEENENNKNRCGKNLEKMKITEWFADFGSNSTSYEKFPFNLWSHKMRQVLNSGDEKLLLRVGVKGVFELRLAISRYLKEFRNMNVNPEQIVIGAGTENLYSMVVQLLGRNNLFAVENPGYQKVLYVCKLNGANAVPIKIDSQGIDINELENSKVNIVHVSPSHHFPTGIVMPIRRRQEILNWAQNSKNRYIIEDDYDSEFRFSGKPLPTLQSADKNGKVIYINTFSKTLAPSFRISYMVLPQKLLPEFEQKIGFYSCPVSSFEQFTLAKFIDDGSYGKHIIRMKNFYRNLRNTLISAIQTSRFAKFCKIQEQESGLHFLLTIENNFSQAELVNRLNAQKINLPLLTDFYYTKNSPDKTNTFVVNYSGIKKSRIPEIVNRLEKAILGE